MHNEPKSKFESTYKEIEEMLGKTPKRNYVVFWLFGCHGIHLNGTQYIAFNEYDQSTKFYKLVAAEEKIRDLAEKYPNSY